MVGTFFYVRNFLELETSHPFGYFWAVSLEMQFFIVFSLVVYLFNRYKLKHILYFVVLVCCIALSMYRPGLLSSDYFRIDALLIGILVFKLKNDNYLKDINNNLMSLGRHKKRLMFFVLLLSLASSLKILSYFSCVKFTITSIISGLLLILAVYENDIISFGISQVDKIFIIIGDFSYSIYVVHVISWWIATDILFNLKYNYNQWIGLLICFIFMAICSFLNKKFIE